MRAGAASFRIQDLPEVHGRCRAQGCRVYLTLNTLVFAGELGDLRRLVDHVAPWVDAVIAWDPAVIQACRSAGVPFHVSTQASIANPEAARFYRDLGAERVVPARECTLDEVARIRHEAGVEVEVFAHGAMCVSVSGRCFLSQFTSGRSGNRGECRQNCRRLFRIVEEDNGAEFELGHDYVLSAKDLCTLPFLDQILNAGVDALKIEGRNRPPEYVHTVVGAYRRAVDAWAAGSLDDKLRSELTAEVATVFNRGFSAGFYLGRPVAEFTAANGSLATQRKEFVGRVLNYYRRVGVAEIQVQDQVFAVGDSLQIQGPSSGVVPVRVRELRQDEVPVECAARGVVTLPVPRRVRAGDRVFRFVPT
jgi:putative protease